MRRRQIIGQPGGFIARAQARPSSAKLPKSLNPFAALVDTNFCVLAIQLPHAVVFPPFKGGLWQPEWLRAFGLLA
jgi:hypothetical protein